MRIHHKLKENSIYQCSSSRCKRKFPSLNSYRKHIKSRCKSSNVDDHNLDLTSAEKNNDKGNIPNNYEANTLETEKSLNIPDIKICPDSLLEGISDNSENIENMMEEQIALVISELYGNSILPRNQIQLFIMYFSDLIELPMQTLKSEITKIIVQNKVSENDQLKIANL